MKVWIILQQDRETQERWINTVYADKQEAEKQLDWLNKTRWEIRNTLEQWEVRE